MKLKYKFRCVKPKPRAIWWKFNNFRAVGIIFPFLFIVFYFYLLLLLFFSPTFEIKRREKFKEFTLLHLNVAFFGFLLSLSLSLSFSVCSSIVSVVFVKKNIFSTHFGCAAFWTVFLSPLFTQLTLIMPWLSTHFFLPSTPHFTTQSSKRKKEKVNKSFGESLTRKSGLQLIYIDFDRLFTEFTS